MILIIIFAFCVGFLADSMGKSFIFWTVLSFLFTPFITGFILVMWKILY